MKRHWIARSVALIVLAGLIVWATRMDRLDMLLFMGIPMFFIVFFIFMAVGKGRRSMSETDQERRPPVDG